MTKEFETSAPERPQIKRPHLVAVAGYLAFAMAWALVVGSMK